MFMTLFAVLLVLWLLGFLAFHVAGGLIHLLLIIAVNSVGDAILQGPKRGLKRGNRFGLRSAHQIRIKLSRR